MVTFAPIAILVAAIATVAFTFVSFWDTITAWSLAIIKRFGSMLDRAGIRRSPEEVFVTVVVVAAAIWVAAIVIFRPNPIGGILMLPVAALFAGAGFVVYVGFTLAQRVRMFVEQLEVALRLMASGLRSGLGLRQTLALVVDEANEPSRYEYSRVIAQTNVGASVHDALDDLSERIKTNDTLMMARVIRIQSQTGGDLAQILERLANTIKSRRQMLRKIDSITAEARMGALILAILPPALGAYIVITQPEMGHALIATDPGHIALLIVAILEMLGVFTLLRILKVNV